MYWVLPKSTPPEVKSTPVAKIGDPVTLETMPEGSKVVPFDSTIFTGMITAATVAALVLEGGVPTML